MHSFHLLQRAVALGLLSLCLALVVMPAQAVAASTLHRGVALEPETLDPHLVKSAEASTIVRDLYEGLVRQGPAGEVLPGQARGWQVSDDGRTYRFELRDDARWCNGRNVTAQEFVAGFRRNFDSDLGAINSNRWRVIEGAAEIAAGEADIEALGVRAIDDHVVEIRLREPRPAFLQMLYHPSGVPHFGDNAEAGKDCPGGVISNGAYVLKSRKSYDHVELQKNAAYWDHAQVAIPTVKYHVIDDAHTELRRFRAGDLHITYTVPPGRFDWLKENFPAEFRVAPYFATYFFGLNTEKPPFAGNIELRRALSLAIDRERLVTAVTGNGEVPAYTWTPPGIDGYRPPAPLAFELPRAERHMLARSLYREAGYSDDRALRVTLHYNAGDIHKRVALAVAGMWRDVLGVETELDNMEWKVLLSRRGDGQLPLFRDGWAGDVLDPGGFAEAMLSASENNHVGFDDDRYDELVLEAGRVQDDAERFALYREAEARLLAYQPIIPIYHYVSKNLVSRKIGGWQDNPLNHHLSRYLYFKDD